MKKWFSTSEIAALDLPGLPSTREGIAKKAKKESWATSKMGGKSLARPRKGRGGGMEYHVSLLPDGARRALMDDHSNRGWKRTYNLLSFSITIDIQRRGRS